MPSVESIRRVTIQARVDGAAAAEAALNRVRVATKDLDASAETAAKNMASNAAAVLKARRSYEELFKATEDLTRLQKTLAIGVAAGRIAQDAANRIYEVAADKATGLSKALEKAAADQARLEAETAAAVAASNRLRASFDGQFAAASKLGAGMREVAEAEHSGVLATNLAIAARQKLTLAHEQALYAMSATSRATAASSQNNLRDNLGFRAAPNVEDRGADMMAAIEGQDRLRAKYDQTFAAEQKLAAATAEINQLLASGGFGAEGAAERAAKAIERETAAYRSQIDAINGVVKAAAPLTSAQRWANLRGDAPAANQGMSSGQAGAALGSMSSNGLPAMSTAAQKLRNELVPLAAAQDALAAATTKADAAVRAGAISQSERDAFVDRSTATFHNQRIEIDKADQANARAAKGAGLNAYAWTNLSYQVNDVVTSLASGISPMQTLAQQGGQVFQILQSDQGGVKGGLKSVRDGVMGLITPTRLAFGGIVAGAAAAALATYQFGESQANVRRAVSGAGRASGVTAGQVNSLAEQGAAGTSVTNRDAREMASQYAATGRIGGAMYVDLIRSAKDYAKVTGQDVSEANKALATAFADPAKGAESLNERLGFLNDTSRETIQRLAAQGDRLGAQKALFDAYKTALVGATDLTSAWGKISAAVIKPISDAWDELGKRIDKVATGGSLEDQIESARKVLAESRALQTSMIGRGAASIFGQDPTKDLAALNALLEKQKGVQAGNDKAAQDQRRLEVGDIVKGANPAAESLKKMEDSAANIRRAFEDLKIKDPFGPAYNTMVGMEASAKRMREDMAAGGSSFADAVRAAQFSLKTVSYAPTASTAAGIDEAARNKDIQALRAANENAADQTYLKQAQSNEAERVALQQALQQRMLNETSSGSSRYARGIGQVPEAYRQFYIDASNKTGVNADLLASQGYTESRYNPKAVSPSGAQGISQFMPDTARGVGLSDPFDPRASIMKQAELMATLLKQYNGNEVNALVGYNASVKTRNKFEASGNDTSVLPKETQEYLKKILTAPPGAEQMVKDEVARRTELQVQNDIIRENKALLGQDNLTLEARSEAIRKIAAAEQAGVAISDSYRAATMAAATAMATAAQSLKVVQFTADARFDREQLGRSDMDQSAYAKARSVAGDTTSPAAQFVIEQQKINDNLKETKALAKDAFSGIATDLSHGASAMDAITSAFTRFADKLISTAADKAISGLFGGLTGTGASGGGDFLGSIMSFFGGGSAIPKFAKGGIMTGPSIAGEAGPEAAVPLPDGRNIPVVLSQPANSNRGGNVSVQVNNTVSDRADAQVTTAPDGTLMIDILDKGLAKKQAAGRSEIGRAAQAGLRG